SQYPSARSALRITKSAVATWTEAKPTRRSIPGRASGTASVTSASSNARAGQTSCSQCARSKPSSHAEPSSPAESPYEASGHGAAGTRDASRVRRSRSRLASKVATATDLSLGFLGRAEQGAHGVWICAEVPAEHVVDQGKVAEPGTGHIFDVHVAEEPGVG